jgi:biopolymer transport protein ExbD
MSCHEHAEHDDDRTRSRLRNRRRDARPAELTMNMTPMIDIVFQLVIFFMVVSEFQHMELEQITLPFALEGRIDEPTGTRRVVVNVAADGTLTIMRARLTSERLRTMLAARAEAAGRDAAGHSHLRVKVRADAECEYRRVQEVMIQCQELGIPQLSFGAHEALDEGSLEF